LISWSICWCATKDAIEEFTVLASHPAAIAASATAEAMEPELLRIQPHIQGQSDRWMVCRYASRYPPGLQKKRKKIKHAIALFVRLLQRNI
jgi:hypothetical protein